MASLTFANITEAAIEQGWSVERTAKQHRRLIPPDKSKPIVVASWMSRDPKAVKHHLSQMRLSGLIWPPPDPCAQKLRNPNREEDVADVSDYVPSRSTLFRQQPSYTDEVDESDDEVQDQWIPVVADRPIAPGYVMNIDGGIQSPSGNVLKPELKGKQLWIGFKPLNAMRYVVKKSRLDRVVLLTWVGEPVDPDAQAMHINDDPLDCRPDNLRWPCDVKPWHDEESAELETYADVDEVEGDLPYATANGATPQVAEPLRQPDVVDDDISVKFILSNNGIDLIGAFTSTGAFGNYSITVHDAPNGRIDGLSGDDLKMLGAIIARWQKVADQL